VRADAHTTVFHPSEMELMKVTALLLEETRKRQLARIVFDSPSMLLTKEAAVDQLHGAIQRAVQEADAFAGRVKSIP
jgi:hypothetical protein